MRKKHSVKFNIHSYKTISKLEIEENLLNVMKAICGEKKYSTEMLKALPLNWG